MSLQFLSSYRSCLFDVTAAILVYKTTKTAAMLVHRKESCGVEDISTMKNCICSNKFVKLLTTWVKMISTNHWVLSCFRWVTTSAFCSPWRILLTTKDLKTKHPFGRLVWLTWTSTFTTWTRSRGSGCIWSPSLAEELYLESREGLREWMMTSGLLYRNLFGIFSF